ncbi:hypothetical protein HDU90_001764 [Geranomyces variabilis]|nr:hypothetical protein HDU90_001764 [Geranomyces variabilis]
MQTLPLHRPAGAAAEHQEPAGDGIGDLSLRPIAAAVNPATVVAAVVPSVKTVKILQYGPVSGVEGTAFHLLLPASSLFDAGIYSIGFGACRANAACSYNRDGTLDLAAVVPSRSQAFFGNVSAEMPRFARLCLILEQGSTVYSGPLWDNFEYKDEWLPLVASPPGPPSWLPQFCSPAAVSAQVPMRPTSAAEYSTASSLHTPDGTEPELHLRYTESLGSDYMTTPTSATTPNEPWFSSPSSSPPVSPVIKHEPGTSRRPPLPYGCEGHYCVIDTSVVELGNFCDWTLEEISVRRRCVRARVSEESPRVCYFDRLSHAETNEEDVVVSCIYWEELQARWGNAKFLKRVFRNPFGSVIILLGYIMDVVLDVPQKNRIRRNLESLGPTTISKKPDTNAFFAQIMSYTDPKPRNIEKDVKVFPWALLKPALEKILFKMTDGGGNGMRQSESE